VGFLALALALLIEQVRPLSANNLAHRASAGLADLVRGSTDAGQRQHGIIGWAVVGLVILGVVALLDWIAGRVHPLLVFILHVAVLYATVGFRQFSHAFTEIQVALAADDLPGARRVLERWLAASSTDDEFELPPSDAPVDTVCRLAIAHALVAAHRHVFAPLFCYMLFPGALGPVLYRLAELLARRWSVHAAHGETRVIEPYGFAANWIYRMLDWVLARITAAGFAIVGNFEDAVYCWRGAVASGTAGEQRALLLAAGGGALGLRIAEPALEARWVSGEQGFEWQGATPDAAGLRSAVGLVWRSVILWAGFFALVSLAAWVGR
jgi:cobalamin biosynthesis protein CobD/CbiB